MSSPDYSDGLANVQYPVDSCITYCLVSCFLLLGALPWYTYFKGEIQRIFACIETIIKWMYFSIMGIFETYGLYVLWKELRQLQPHEQQNKHLKTNSLIHTLPPYEEFITEVRTIDTTPIYGTNNIFSGFTVGLSGIWYRIFIKLAYLQHIYRKNPFLTGCSQ